jgi:TonB-linked SusC/RagA family outer membrane protein
MCRSGLRGLGVLLAGALVSTAAVSRAGAQAPASVPAAASVRGTVVDDRTGEPVTGATIAVAGAAGVGTQTNDQGTFSVRVPDLTATLVVSRIGYAQSRIPIAGRMVVSVRLARVAVTLNDVVVVGYGTQRRADVTGSVVSISPQQLEDKPNTNLAQALEGALPGVTVTNSGGGGADQTPSIQIRGRSSITASTSPLVVVDGIPYNSTLSDINPNDIASIEVLKDATAAAIYGSRSANGVILVTTKKGTTGKARVAYSGYSGAQRVAHVPDLMNAAQFAAFKCVRLSTTAGQDCNTTLTATEQRNLAAGVDVDWVGEATHVGRQTQNDVNVSGGSEDTKYFLGASYLNVDGVARNDLLERALLRANVDERVNRWLRLGTNTQGVRTDRGGVNASFTNSFYANPLISPYNADGSLAIVPWAEDPTTNNALEGLNATNDDVTRRLFSSSYLELTAPFITGLTYRFNGGFDIADRNTGTYYGRNTSTGLPLLGQASITNTQRTNWTAENVLHYAHDFGRHTIDATGLYSNESQRYELLQTRASGFPNDVNGYRSSVPTLIAAPLDTVSPLIQSSEMGRLNYAYADRYLLTGTVRRDCASVFGANYKCGTFPSAAVGWNLSREGFFPFKSTVDELKIRLSVGKNGNQAISPYTTFSALDDRSYLNGDSPAAGYIPVTLGNPNLRWESKVSRNVGVDVSLWHERVRASVDAYTSRSSDLLLDRAISPVHGITHIVENVGQTANRGLELQLNTENLHARGFQWNTDFNISANRNKIVSLASGAVDDIGNGWFIGQPIDVNYGYRMDGIWQTGDSIAKSAQPTAKPGDVRIRDMNGDGKIDASDRTIIGHIEPRYIAGLTNTVRYKRFTASAALTSVQGTTRANPLLGTNQVFADVRRNTVYREYWTPTNPINTYPANSNSSNPLSVTFYENASYVRLRDVSLAYDLPTRLLGRTGAESLRLYVDGRNLWTNTKWTGLDPEIDNSNQRGIPLEKSVIAGLDLRF